MKRLSRAACAAAAIGLLAAMPLATGQPRPAVRGFTVPLAQTTNRIIVKLKPGVDGRLTPSRFNPSLMAMTDDRAAALSVSAGTPLTAYRVMADGAHVLKLDRLYRNVDAAQITGRLMQDPTVEYAEPDTWRFPQQAAVNDHFYATDQWYLWGNGGTNVGLNIEPAWTTSQGSGVVVAVIDTGLLAHPDITSQYAGNATLGTNLGYDFITDIPTGNSGLSRNADATDAGDWVTAQDSASGQFAGCPVQDSDWHGTHTTGLIAATANNGIGIAGVAYGAKIVPLRVLGKCGGVLSDIADAIRWAAGLPSVAQPPNMTIPAQQKAQIINLSLGAEPGILPACSNTEQSAITAALGNGVKAIVVAAGNDVGTDIVNVTPASCSGVITVTATDRNGSLTPYTNIGSNPLPAGVTLVAAPGGNFVANGPNSDGILSLWNPGSDGMGGTTPIAFDSSNTSPDYAYFIGTSESTALVSGVAALMLSANPNLTSANVASYLAGSARGFPDCTCTTTTCGAGIVDATTAVQSAVSNAIVAGPATGCHPTPVVSTLHAGGSGGCVTAPDGDPDFLLPLLAAMALLGLRARRMVPARIARPTADGRTRRP